MPEVDARKEKLSEARRKLLEKRLKGKGSTPKADQPMPRRSSAAPAPLSLAQERFWFLHQLSPDDPTYNMHEAWQAEGPLNVAALEWAVNQVIARQAALRTTIGRDDGQVVQIVHRELSIKVTQYDVSHLDGSEQDAETRRIAEEEARELFDLHKGPLIRFAVIKQAEQHHTLLYTIHHIISDENSNDIFWQELAHFYLVNESNGEGASLADLPVEYCDFSEWQREWLIQGEREKQLRYWENQLAGESELLQLPLDENRPSRQSTRGGFLGRQFANSLAPKVQALVHETGATPFMIFLALFQTLLHRYSQQDDIWVGSPIANRQRAEVKHLIGLFLNTIIIRNQFQPELSFRNLVELVKQRAFAAFTHQDLPFEQLVDHLQPHRDPAYHPLFQVMFVYSPVEALSRSLPGLQLSRLPVDGGVAKFDLTLFVASDAQSIEAGFEYNADIFRPETIERMLHHLECLLAAALAAPNQLLSDLSYLSEPELTQLAAWNPPPQTRSDGRLLHHLIEAQVAEKPDAPAIRYDGETVSYAELNQQALRLAGALQASGVTVGDYVGLFAERRPEMFIGILAILKAGAAYVPIDPDYPDERIKHIVEDADLKVVLNCSESELPASVRETALLPIHDLLNGSIQPFVEPAQDDQSLAYLIYTSGSTGKPKGVMVSHANFVHSTVARFHYYDQAVSRFLLLSSFAFDSSLVGIFWTLCQGGALVLPTAGLHQNVRYLCESIAKERVTHLLALPSLYQILLEEGGARQLRSLNTVVVAGEACHASLVAQHYQSLPDAVLYNEYGPTEGTVWSHAYRFPPDFVGPAVPIGAAIPNVQGFVLDRQQQLLPVGVPGELVLGGAGITRGYLNRPDLTGEKFIQIPALGDASARYYRTGDLVRWRPDGNLDFLGRVDHQVKIRGFRIEPGEVEAAILDHPGVQAAAVIVHEDARSGRSEKQLVGYFVADERVDDAAIRTYLDEQLPTYMVPAQLIALETLPYLANGKVDRKALPRPGASRRTVSYEAPRDGLEEMLADHWQKLLGVKDVSIHANFFALGGHSLLALRLFARIEEVTGRKMLLSTLFEAPTIAALAERIRDRQYQPAFSSLVPIKPTGFKRPFFYVSPYTISVLELNNIGKYFDRDRPFYGLQPSGLDAREQIHDSIPAMAAHYIESIRSVQPEGPYLIAGHCDGGWVAYEMAIQLQEMGEQVGYLGLVDLPAPASEDHYHNRLSRLKGRIRYYFNNRRFLYALAWKLRMQFQSKLLYRFGNETSRRIEAVRKAHAEAFATYRFRYEYKDKINFILSSENLEIDQNMNWYQTWEDDFAQQIYYSNIDSTHDRLLYDPDARYLANAFATVIDAMPFQPTE